MFSGWFVSSTEAAIRFSRWVTFAHLLVIVTLLANAGCKRPGQADKESHAFRVALLTPGPVSDAGWNAAAFDGLRLIKQDLGADTALVQTRSPADFDDGFRDFASRGYNLIFAHGYEYTDSAISVARDFSDVIFVISSGSKSSRNVASLTFKLEQAAYVEGVLAGGMTKTGIVGAVGGIELPSIRESFDGFRRGFLEARPRGRVLVSYTGSFDDVGIAKEAALAQISRGADLIIHDADAAGLGVFEAAAQAHILAFGAIRNQNDVMPGVVLASAVCMTAQAFLRIATEVKNHDFRAGMLAFGMEDGMVRVVLNPRLEGRIPAAVMQRFMAAERAFARRYH